MLKLREDQLTLWDSIIPEDVWKLPEELAKVDALLDDERFMQPFLEKHQTRRGRPTKSIETFLRLMYLKRRYNFGKEIKAKHPPVKNSNKSRSIPKSDFFRGN